VYTALVMKSRTTLVAIVGFLVAAAAIRLSTPPRRAEARAERAPATHTPELLEIKARAEIRPDPVEESDEEEPSIRVKKPLDFKKLRLAVRSGDRDRVEAIRGEPPPESAEEIFNLVAEIPGDTAPEAREKIVGRLMTLLRRIPGDEGARFLLLAVMQEGLLSYADWAITVGELGRRRASEALPFLESLAFDNRDFEIYPQAGERMSFAAGALLSADVDRYLPEIVRRVRRSTDSSLPLYLYALASMPENARPEIGALIPFLQERYGELSGSPWSRHWILDVAADYAVGSKSKAVRQWTITELKKGEVENDKTSIEAMMMRLRLDLLNLLEETDE